MTKKTNKQITPAAKKNALTVMRIVLDSEKSVDASVIHQKSGITESSGRRAITLAVNLGLISRVGHFYCDPKKEVQTKAEIDLANKKKEAERAAMRRAEIRNGNAPAKLKKRMTEDAKKIRKALADSDGPITKSELKKRFGLNYEYMNSVINLIGDAVCKQAGGYVEVTLKSKASKGIKIDVPETARRFSLSFIAVRPERETRPYYQNGAVVRVEV